MGGTNSTVQERHSKRLERHFRKYKETAPHHTTCIYYNPRASNDFWRRVRSVWFLSAIENIVDTKKEEGLKLLLKAMEKCCICIRSVPMIRAIHTGNLESLQLLLDNGGEKNPVISVKTGAKYCDNYSCRIRFCPFGRTSGENYLNFVPFWVSHWDHCPTSNGPEILKCLVNAQSDVNINILGSDVSGCFDTSMSHLVRMKLYVGSKLLDALFRNGCRLDELPIALTYALMSQEGHVNYVIWLVRHGVFTRVTYTNFYHNPITLTIETRKYSAVEVLLHAGATPNKKGIHLLENSECQSRHSQDSIKHTSHLEGVLTDQERRKAFEASHVYRQGSDLQEFSDESLNIYPEPDLMTDDQCLQRIIDFISQPAPLKWLCHRKLRHNMVSHCPSAVNSIPLPKPLKRYVMCHTV